MIASVQRLVCHAGSILLGGVTGRTPERAPRAGTVAAFRCRPATLVLVMLCVAAAAAPRPASAAQDSVPAVQLRATPDCAGCTVRLVREATITGEDIEELGGVTRGWLKRDSRGRYYTWNGFVRQVVVFDADGRFLRRLGRRGDGPGEYRGVHALHVGAGDTLHLIDFELLRYLIFSAEHEFVRSHRIDARPRNVLDLRPGRLVFDGFRVTPGAYGYALHLFADSAVTASFGGTHALSSPTGGRSSGSPAASTGSGACRSAIRTQSPTRRAAVSRRVPMGCSGCSAIRRGRTGVTSPRITGPAGCRAAPAGERT
jgi:hypothetical protein